MHSYWQLLIPVTFLLIRTANQNNPPPIGVNAGGLTPGDGDDHGGVSFLSDPPPDKGFWVQTPPPPRGFGVGGGENVNIAEKQQGITNVPL